jgi:hypothetical protein
MFKKAGDLLKQIDETLENISKDQGQYHFVVSRKTFQWNNLFFSNKKIFIKLIEASFMKDTCICKYLHKYFKLNGKIQSCLNALNKLKQNNNLQKSYKKPKKEMITQSIENKPKITKTTMQTNTNSNTRQVKKVYNERPEYARDYRYMALSDLGKVVVNDDLVSLDEAFQINEDSYFRNLLER